jgi:hypothetical protein
MAVVAKPEQDWNLASAAKVENRLCDKHLKSQPIQRSFLPKRDYTVRVSRESRARAGSVAIDFTGDVRAGIRTRRNA